MSDDATDEPRMLLRRRARAKPLRVPIEHVTRVSVVDPDGWSTAVPLQAAPTDDSDEPDLRVEDPLSEEIVLGDDGEEAAAPRAPQAAEPPSGDPAVSASSSDDDDDSAELTIGPATGEFDSLDEESTADRLAESLAPPAPTSVPPPARTPSIPPPSRAPSVPPPSRTPSSPPSATPSIPPPPRAPSIPPPASLAASSADDDIELEEMSEQEIALHGRPSAPKAPPAPPQKAPPAPPEASAKGPPPAPQGAAAPKGPPPAPPAEARPPKPPAEPPLPKKRQRPWYEDFFSDDYLRTVRHPTEREIARECDFIEKTLGLPAGATILDVGCGLGLHAIELTKRGYLVVGLDLSLPMLSRASEDAKDQGLRINFLHGDMRDMSFEGAFDAVLCWGTSLGYFDDEGNRKVLSRFHSSLKPGGQLLLDVTNRDYVVRSQPNLVWFEGDGCICMEETRVNYLSSRLEVSRNVILDDGTQRDRAYSIRLYGLHELGQMLHQTRFRVVQVSGLMATPGVFFGADSPRIILLAERKREEEVRSSPPPAVDGPATGPVDVPPTSVAPASPPPARATEP